MNQAIFVRSLEGRWQGNLWQYVEGGMRSGIGRDMSNQESIVTINLYFVLGSINKDLLMRAFTHHSLKEH
jgi:hypothetical protein